MSTSIIKYALDKSTAKPVHIDAAVNGLLCNCNCAKCGQHMVAVQGKSANHREWHFRHYVDSDCSGGQETAIHKLAKQIIVDNAEISIPGDTLIYSNARQELKFQTIIPDVTVTAGEYQVHFEIEVTNPVDRTKEAFYKTGKHKSVKIDLSNVLYTVSPQELEELVIRQAGNKTKIFWETSVAANRNTGSNTFIGVVMFILGLLLLGNLTNLADKDRIKNRI